MLFEPARRHHSYLKQPTHTYTESDVGNAICLDENRRDFQSLSQRGAAEKKPKTKCRKHSIYSVPLVTFILVGNPWLATLNHSEVLSRAVIRRRWLSRFKTPWKFCFYAINRRGYSWVTLGWLLRARGSLRVSQSRAETRFAE